MTAQHTFNTVVGILGTAIEWTLYLILISTVHLSQPVYSNSLKCVVAESRSMLDQGSP